MVPQEVYYTVPVGTVPGTVLYCTWNRGEQNSPQMDFCSFESCRFVARNYFRGQERYTIMDVLRSFRREIIRNKPV